MLALVPSRNDAEALRRALSGLMKALRPGRDELLVIADRCSDDTGEVARSAGVGVAERSDDSEGAGKAGALLWALRQRGDVSPDSPVAVFDADSEPAADFFSRAEGVLGSGVRAAQARIEPVPGQSLLSRLAAYSEIVSQRFSDRFREALGWGVPLRGTGMVIARQDLEVGLAQCRTEVEDLELTLLLAARGVRVRRLPSFVKDPKPETAAGVAAQRSRWFAGNLAALSARRREIGGLCASLEGLTLVLSLFGKPRSLFFSLRAILLLALLLSGAAGIWRAGEILVGLLLVRDLVPLLGGLFVVDRPLFYLPAILVSPLYPLLWLASGLGSLRARGKWLSARPRA
jgi:cellulose synthase/poly-beta-1,6-N-acetylglucosamine synthase-like glycosyltransferase